MRLGFTQTFKMAIKSILGGKMRSFLTMLGVIIGVAAVISAVAFAKGSTKKITDSIQSLGTNLIQINITGRNSNRNVSLKQLQDFADENSDMVDIIAPAVRGSVTVKAGTESKTTTVIGTSPEYEDIKDVHVQAGRFILDYDDDYYLKTALVGTAIVNDLYDGMNPVGQTIKVNGQVFKVVGVLEERASGEDNTDDDQIIIPYTVAQRVLKSMHVTNFLVQAANTKIMDNLITKLDTFLLNIYGDSKSFNVFNQTQMLSTLKSVTGTLMVILGGIAAISLVVGGIGIMNIMLVSVTERTREIGIRKSIGAKRRDILVQFLIEAIIVTGIGGIIGVLLGIGIIKFIIGGLNLVPAVYSIEWMVISFGISLVVGVIFGMYPANKAARLNPIEALRVE